MHAGKNRKVIARILFYVVPTMPIARQLVATHILAEADEQNNEIHC
jgi:hypothetical protein